MVSVPKATELAAIVATPPAVIVTSPDTCENIDPDIAGVNVVVLTATSSAFTVMCVPAPTAKVGVEPSPDAPPVRPLPDVMLAT